MVELLLYPTTYDATTWTNPNNVLGPPDSLCGLSPAGCIQEKLVLHTFKDALGNPPDIAGVINDVYVGFKTTTLFPPNLPNGAYVNLVKGGLSVGRDGGYCNAVVCGCTHSSSVFLEIKVPFTMTIDDINNENYYCQTWFAQFVACAELIQRAIVDYVRVRVLYTPPAPIFGDGLVWITAALKRRKLKPLHLPPLGGMLKRG